MKTSNLSSRIPILEQLIGHLREPFYRNGYALVVNSATTSGLGMLYWILAARNYSPETIGLNAAVISAMMFLANISQLSLMNVLNRFIPTGGKATGRMIIYAYLISTAVALVASLIFIAGIDIWASRLDFIRTNLLFTVWFTLATMAWCVFVLQDSALIGLRQAIWVPVENLVFSLAKIVLLVGLVSLLPKFGVFASWTIPLVLLLVSINALLFWRLIPWHVSTSKERTVPTSPYQVGKFVAGDYLATLFWMASTSLLPLIVLQGAGAEANAHFYLPWMIAYSLQLVSRNMGQSLITEAAGDQTKLYEYSRRMFVQTARLTIPAVAVLAVTAPYLLRLFGNSYSDEGTTLLRLLSLSALPVMVTLLFVSIARVQRRMMAIILVHLSLAALVLPLSYFLMQSTGITGVGIAWLASQTIVATVLLLTQLRGIWTPRLSLEIVLWILGIVRRFVMYWALRRQINSAQKLVPQILPSVPAQVGASRPTDWIVQGAIWPGERRLRTDSKVGIVMLGPSERPPEAVLKLFRGNKKAAGLNNEGKVLENLHNDPRLGRWSALLPKPLLHGDISGNSYAVESALPGSDARLLASDPGSLARMQIAAVATIGELHRRTATSTVISEGVLERWIDQPLLHIRRFNASLPRYSRHDAAIERLAAELHGVLAGRALTTGWIHGDFWPGNILVTPHGETVTGIVDWEYAAHGELPAHDLLFLLLSTRALVQNRLIGEIVRDWLSGAAWTPHEEALLSSGRLSVTEDAEQRAVVLLTWLRHSTAKLAEISHYTGHWIWTTKNVESVLRCL